MANSAGFWRLPRITLNCAPARTSCGCRTNSPALKTVSPSSVSAITTRCRTTTLTCSSFPTAFLRNGRDSGRTRRILRRLKDHGPCLKWIFLFQTSNPHRRGNVLGFPSCNFASFVVVSLTKKEQRSRSEAVLRDYGFFVFPNHSNRCSFRRQIERKRCAGNSVLKLNL